MLEAALAHIARSCETALGDKLAGAYLHGSTVLGGFQWATSDIDFLVVAREEPTLDEKETLLGLLLRSGARYPAREIEMSVVSLADCRAPRCPTPYTLHYSEMWRDAYARDPRAYCENMRGLDCDLAAHFAVTRASGRALCGMPIPDAFAEVPRDAYLDSVTRDLSESDLADAPAYTLLNLCRTRAYLCDGVIRSKLGGGQWALEHLPADYAPIIRAAMSQKDDPSAAVDFEQASRLAEYLRGAILE